MGALSASRASAGKALGRGEFTPHTSRLKRLRAAPVAGVAANQAWRAASGLNSTSMWSMVHVSKGKPAPTPPYWRVPWGSGNVHDPVQGATLRLGIVGLKTHGVAQQGQPTRQQTASVTSCRAPMRKQQPREVGFSLGEKFGQLQTRVTGIWSMQRCGRVLASGKWRGQYGRPVV